MAQIGAVIGREFSYDLLAAVAPLRDDQLQDALTQLVEAELIFRRGTPPHATYSFKHALVQDAAYQSLLKSRRQQLHARITQVLEERVPEVAEVQPELLAYHCTQAGLIEQAVAYWHKAGLRAMARSTYREAIAQLTQGLDLVPSLPDSLERRRRELDLRVALGGARIAATGWAAPETGATYARARELCQEMGDTPQLIPVLWGLFQFHINRAELRKSWEIAEEFLRMAEQRQQDTAARVISHRVTGINLQYLGRLAPALSHHEQALASYDPSERRSPVFFAAVDTRVHSLGFTAWILLHQGYPDQALTRIRQALAGADAHPSGARRGRRAGPPVQHGLRAASDVRLPPVPPRPAGSRGEVHDADVRGLGAGVSPLAGDGHDLPRLGGRRRWRAGGGHRRDAPRADGQTGAVCGTGRDSTISGPRRS